MLRQLDALTLSLLVIRKSDLHQLSLVLLNQQDNAGFGYAAMFRNIFAQQIPPRGLICRTTTILIAASSSPGNNTSHHQDLITTKKYLTVYGRFQLSILLAPSGICFSKEDCSYTRSRTH